jgi:hypothetical protein
MRSIVEVDLADGRTVTEVANERYRGGPQRPFTKAELSAKFRECAELVLSNDAIDETLDLLEVVDELPDMRQLVKAMTPKRVGAGLKVIALGAA